MADNKYPDDFYLPLLFWLWMTCSLTGGKKFSEEATAFSLGQIRLHYHNAGGYSLSTRRLENLKYGKDDECPTSNKERNTCPKFKALIPGCRQPDTKIGELCLHIRRSTLQVNPSKLYSERVDIKFFIRIVHKSIVNRQTSQSPFYRQVPPVHSQLRGHLAVGDAFARLSTLVIMSQWDFTTSFTTSQQ